MPTRAFTFFLIGFQLLGCSRTDDATRQRAASLSASPFRAMASLAARCGSPEVPRYIKHRELDPQNPTRVLRPPTLQRGRPGQPIVVRKDRVYLYAIAADGTFLVADKAPFGKNSECGHPNLTGGKPARISGELHYDRARGKLVIDNKSGRYGYQLSRRRPHLAAARALLARVGVRYPDGGHAVLAEQWIEPRRGAKYRLIDCIRPFIKDAPAGFDGNGWRSAFVSALGLATAERSARCAELLAHQESGKKARQATN